MKPVSLGQVSKTQSVESSSSKLFITPPKGIPLWVACGNASASDSDQYESQKHFLDGWAKHISFQDPKFFAGCANDPHIYLIKKVRRMLKIVKGGHWPWGWPFGENGVGQIIPCFVWSDGTKSQLEPLKTPQGWERWWPCIVIPAPDDQWQFYCPALAWSGPNGSRAWGVHNSRVWARRFPEDSPYTLFSGPAHTLGGSSTGSESGATDSESSYTSMSWTTVPLSSDSESDAVEEEGWEILD